MRYDSASGRSSQSLQKILHHGLTHVPPRRVKQVAAPSPLPQG